MLLCSARKNSRRSHSRLLKCLCTHGGSGRCDVGEGVAAGDFVLAGLKTRGCAFPVSPPTPREFEEVCHGIPLRARAIFLRMTPSPAARSELAPTGKLRVGVNYGNFLLVNKDPASGEYRGIAVDLGRELGRRLNVPVDLVAFETAGKL